MKRIIFWSSISILVIALTLFQSPQVKFKLLEIFADKVKLTQEFMSNDSLNLVLCGSRSPLAAPGRAETCFIVKAGNDLFIIDSGNGSAANILGWNIPLKNLNAVLLTHLHSDHIGNLGEVHLQSWITGRAGKLKVFGPKGTEDVTKGYELVYKNDSIYRNEHHGDAVAPIENFGYETFIIKDNQVVIDQNNLKITAIKNCHDPVHESYGYLIQYFDRKILISGDTDYCESIVIAAENVDILAHDILSKDILNLTQARMEKENMLIRAKIILDVQDYHATIPEVIDVMKRSNAKFLLTYHMVPAPTNSLTESVYVNLLDNALDNYAIGEDGMVFELPIGSKEIIQTSLQ